MSVSSALPSFELNRKAAIMMAIMAGTQVGAYGLVELVPAFSIPESQQSTGPTLGLGLAVLVIVESLILVLLWRAYRHLPSWIKQAVRSLLDGGASVWVVVSLTAFVLIAVLASGPPRWIAIGGLAATYAAYWIDETEFEWILHNAFAFVISVVAVALLGAILGPWSAIALMVLLIVWDYSAVSLSDLMADLIDFSASVDLPNFFVIPSGLRVDLSAVKEFIRDPSGELPTGCSGVIGVGDFVFPSLLVISAATAIGVVPAVLAGAGTLASLAALTSASKRTDGALPALPWVNAGAIVGFLAGYAVVVLP